MVQLNYISKTAIILLDFDNFIHKPIDEISPELLEYELSEIVLDTLNSFDDIENIEIRLYGGWLQEGKSTKKADTLLQLLSAFNLFPIIIIQSKRKIEGQVTLVKSLLAIPDIIWEDTLKVRKGIPRVRIKYENMDKACSSNKNSCPLHIMNRFTRSKGKTCSVIECTQLNSTVFESVEQKMVDTMIACDLFSLSQANNLAGIYILSDDFDHIPSIIMTASNLNTTNTGMKVGLKNEETCKSHGKMFGIYNIKIKLYE